MFNRRYDKVFIMLRQEISGFSLGERPVWGSCTIEIKNGDGRFTIYVQGLKKLSDGRKYELYAIAGKTGGSIGVSLGTIDIDIFGKGELKFDFDPENVAKTGLAIEAFNVIAVMIKNDTKQNMGILAPLAGYRENKINWRNNFNEFSSIKEKCVIFAAEKTLEKEEVKQENEIKENIEQKAEQENEIKEKMKQEVEQEQKKEETEKLNLVEEMKYIEKQQELVLELQENNLEQNEEEKIQQKKEFAKSDDFYSEFAISAQEKDAQNTFHEIAQKFKKELEELEKAGILSNKELQKINAMPKKKKEENDIDYIFRNNDIVNPFVNKNGFQWRSISIEELVVLPFDSCRFMKHPFIVSGYRKYKHLLLGRDLESNYFLGVPDKYLQEYNEDAKHMGFLEFKTCDGVKSKDKGYGYWIKSIPKDKKEEKMQEEENDMIFQ